MSGSGAAASARARNSSDSMIWCSCVAAAAHRRQHPLVFGGAAVLPQGDFDLAEHRRQRRPQLVRGVAGEPALALQRLAAARPSSSLNARPRSSSSSRVGGTSRKVPSGRLRPDRPGRRRHPRDRAQGAAAQPAGPRRRRSARSPPRRRPSSRRAGAAVATAARRRPPRSGPGRRRGRSGPSAMRRVPGSCLPPKHSDSPPRICSWPVRPTGSGVEPARPTRRRDPPPSTAGGPPPGGRSRLRGAIDESAARGRGPPSAPDRGRGRRPS